MPGEGGRLVEVEKGAAGDVIEDDTAAGRRERFDVASPVPSGSKGGLKGVFRLRRPGMKALRLRVRDGWRGGKEGILRNNVVKVRLGCDLSRVVTCKALMAGYGYLNNSQHSWPSAPQKRRVKQTCPELQGPPRNISN
ncbi:hypothetical protein H106_06930 [Trichophyton rubrum CBS 735.88]|nr:hypothetical protein H106_06930 [Trichophyton rubrum CBS 735.88]